MKGAGKIFIKDLFELWHRPYMFVLFMMLPAFFLYVAGYIQSEEQVIRILYKSNEEAKPDSERVKNLLQEFTNISVVDWKGKDADILSAMETERADLALLWQDKWQFYTRSISHEQQQYLTRIVYEIQAAISLDTPWQLRILNTTKDERNEIVSKIQSFHPSASRNNITLVPRIIAFIVVFLPFLLACGTFIRELENGTLEILLASPRVKWLDIFVGKLLMPLFIAITNFFLLLLLSESWFGIHIKSHLFDAVGTQVLAMLGSALLGLIVSTIVKSQLQAYLIAALYFLCLILMTGFIYPVDQAVELVKVVSHLFPLTFSVEPFSAWMLQGTRANLYSEQLYWLAAQCVLFCIFAWLGILRARRMI